MEKSVDIRGHHLITLSNLHGVQRLMDVEAFRKARAFRLASQNYANAADFNAHLMGVIGTILNGETEKVRIVAEHDSICAGCFQKRENACEVWARRTWSADFLEMADRAIIRSTNGVLIEGEEYSSEYILQNIWQIRLAIVKAAVQVPSLLRFA